MTDTMLRGAKVYLQPNKRQAAQLDLWRRRTISLWNLLLGFQQAAYSGENYRPELRWRKIWVDIVQSNYEKDLKTWKEGWVRKDGSVRKEAGKGPMPEPPSPEQIMKMRGKIGDDEPKLFIWERELMALMARLKQEPLTSWVGDLPSHAAQAIVKDMIKALQAMLRERKKTAGGGNGRDTGFPRFKKSSYAAGSVYFANTQIFFDKSREHVKFPNGVGNIRCLALSRDLRILDTFDNDTGKWRSRVEGYNIPAGAKLMGGRVWREGEDWLLSCQWEMAKPDPLPLTGRTAGVKIGASIILTTYDDRGQTREYTLRPPDKKIVAQHKTAGQALSRVIEAQKAKEKKKSGNGYSKRRAARLAARGKTERPYRAKRTPAFFECSARLADLEATQRNRRDDDLHKLTTEVVRKFDAIAVQKMNVADLMKKPSARELRRETKLKAGEGAPKRRQDMKRVRTMMRHVAMARCFQLLKYKMEDCRGTAAFEGIDPYDANASVCSRCGTWHPVWKDGRRTVRCNSVLPDGSECGNVLPRNRNAARVSKVVLDGRRRRKADAGDKKTEAV